MSIQEWKNHETYLIFPHVLEVCFLEKARKNPKWVKRNVVKDFPQQGVATVKSLSSIGSAV